MALQSYQEYAMEQVTNDEVLAATGFKAHHDACKVALSHIKALVDLAKWVDLPGSENAEGLRSAEVAALIISAQKEIDEGKE